ncbi:MAG: cellulase family glycosylhydrolase, partial [Chloroflexota bacterium]
MNRQVTLIGLWILLITLFTPLTTQAELSNRASLTFADSAFQNNWNRADNLVASGAVSRSWLWGNGFTLAGSELYKQAPGGVRSVQYFDKARMEINNPSVSRQDRFFVTNGLLVKELISGRLAVGDNPAEIEIHRPADNVVIVGDPIEGNPNAPTYATFSKLASLANDNRVPSEINSGFATRTLLKSGETSSNSSLSGLYSGLKLIYYDNNLGHNIPEIFWNFLNSKGNVTTSTGQLVQDNIMDWIKDLGFPLTEAYWTKAVVGGKEKDVMVQAFERRVLTYTPSNNDPYRVEMGNVGLHYFNWRYRVRQAVSTAGPTLYPLLSGSHAAPGVNAEVFGHVDQVPGWMDDLKIKWVRQQVRWQDFEPSKGQRDFTFLDEVVNGMSGNGYKLMLSVVKAPTWANPNGGMPLNAQDFADFMTALVTRYKGKVASYEMWNEQNLASEAGKPIQVSRYVQLVKAGYLAVKQADPFAVVVLGGLSPVGFTDVNAAIDDVVYLKQLYAYNGGEAKKYFDVVGAHPGSNNNPPDTLWPEKPGPGPGWTTDASFYFRRIEQLRQVMVDNGEGSKQIWLTEFGWDSTPTPPPGYDYAKQI